ncbi:hypothetical protein ACFVAV_13460 [Nocardia sp. NPDC057663]|uniref:DUF7065 domain-containing protein n=1 Tax=Nocardia sp. NPDC057663 TaxID=3346201 RepID=UPI003671F4C3
MKPEDDYTHPVGDERNFNESMYFQFHDPTRRIGGFVRLANRPNEGRGERTVCVYLPDGRVAFGFARPEVTSNAKMAGSGLEFHVEEPLTRLRATFDGTINLLDDPEILSDPRQLADTPLVTCTAALVFERLADPYEHSFDGDGPAFAPNHYEQPMAVTGEIVVDGTAYEIDGVGLRDHSWGPRSWQAPWFYRWLHGSTRTAGFMGAYFGSENGAPLTGGFVWDHDGVHHCSTIKVRTERDEKAVTRHIAIELIADDRRSWRFTGKAGVTVPLRHRKVEASGAELTTRILESQVCWTGEDGTELYGMGEYLDQIVAGEPVGLDV